MRIPALTCFACIAGLLQAQTYKLRRVGTEEGLTNTFVHALAQDATGRLWIGTGQGVGSYDGRKVTEFTTDDSLAESYVSSILPATDGSIWFGHNEGGFTHLVHGSFLKVRTAGVSSSTVNAIVNDGHGGIWAVAQNNGVVHIGTKGDVRLATSSEGVLWYALLELEDGRLIAGTSDGLHLFKPGKNDTLIPIGGMDQVTTTPVRSLTRANDGRILAGTEDEGVVSFLLQGNAPKAVATLGEKEGLSGLQVRDMVIGDAGQLIVGTVDQGAYEIGLKNGRITAVQHYDDENGLGANNISVVLVDHENNIWFAGFGIGLGRLLDRAVVNYASEEGRTQDVQALCVAGHDVWFGADGCILHTHKDDLSRMDTLGADLGLPKDRITALLKGPDNSLWAGTEAHGLFRQDKRGHFARVPLAEDLLSNKVHALAANGRAVWVATSNGVYTIDSARTMHLTTENGLMHNQVNAVFIDTQGEVWLACNNGGVSVVRNDTVRSFTLTQQGNAYHVTGIAQDTAGRMWLSTNGNGVWYSDGEVYRAVSAAQGLRSDYCYAITYDRKGSLWVAHRGGISRINAADRTVKTYDRQFGIIPDRRMNTVTADAEHTIWFGTDAGVIRYDMEKDRPILHPPPVSITAIKVFGKDVPPNEDLVLPPDIYRIQFDFMGISLKDPDAVHYRYKLDGHDMEWTTTAQTTALYMHVQDGDFTFMVQAAYADGSFSETPATLRVTVRTPFWKEQWFIALCAVLGLLAVFSVVRIRERNQRIAKEHLQKALDERTHELKTKKEEIEAKNKDITDSINYAQRIQQAILPSEAMLTAHFPHSFILYRPRDIVSGDFYWFRRFGSKFLLACADCTGHGVPGAFMSMIGSMLLREVSADQGVHSPDVVLKNLDGELRNVLQYQGEDSSSHDGMDISICEIDMDSRHIRASAAMHDLLVVHDGTVLRQRGTRRSIGGVMRNDASESFELIDAQLVPGDRVFLFSDGVPDQFGGPSGKKLKVSGLIAWIEDTKALPIAEQAAILRTRFADWLGERDQVDDVLLIGIEV
jgi:ligand-binding sensor domain-containing protein/serine phosphatase RsbU (regulator of sigma subunit)